MQESLDEAKKRMNLSDKVVAIVAILSLAGAIVGVWIKTANDIEANKTGLSSLWAKQSSLEGVGEDVIRLREKVDSLIQTNERSLVIFDRLAESVDRLSISVARLDERTRQLEGSGSANQD